MGDTDINVDINVGNTSTQGAVYSQYGTVHDMRVYGSLNSVLFMHPTLPPCVCSCRLTSVC